MLELRKTSSALLALQTRLSEVREQQSALVASVEQRLKWAAGANPALSEVLAAFESAVNSRSERLNLEQRLSALVGNTCNAVLHHEALRTRTSEALAHDTAFLQVCPGIGILKGFANFYVLNNRSPRKVHHLATDDLTETNGKYGNIL